MAICCGGLHTVVITTSMKSKKKESRPGNLLDVSCFVWGRIILRQQLFPYDIINRYLLLMSRCYKGSLGNLWSVSYFLLHYSKTFVSF
jgi:hypothetical protein